MDPERERSSFTEDDLIGAWQCFKGDGIHSWDNRVLVFRRDGGRVLVDYWLPKKRAGKLRLWGSYGGNCLPTDFGLRLRLKRLRLRPSWLRTTVEDRDDVIDILPGEDGTFLLTHPGTTAGGTYFRRTTWP
jgi:hypothetical protein